ncbi:MAG: hypothetical protein N3E47_00590 [Candidatus Bathyarchaeota archaeon]|nr:hypothetical protein [Candidatus Bathyarchaeota archaeon]
MGGERVGSHSLEDYINFTQSFAKKPLIGSCEGWLAIILPFCEPGGGKSM